MFYLALHNQCTWEFISYVLGSRWMFCDFQPDSILSGTGCGSQWMDTMLCDEVLPLLLLLGKHLFHLTGKKRSQWGISCLQSGATWLSKTKCVDVLTNGSPSSSASRDATQTIAPGDCQKGKCFSSKKMKGKKKEGKAT